KRTGLGRRKDRRFAVNAARGREGQALRALAPHRFEHVRRHQCVLLEILPRVPEAVAHVSVRGEMKHVLDAVEQWIERERLDEIELREPETRIRQGALEEPATARREV